MGGNVFDPTLGGLTGLAAPLLIFSLCWWCESISGGSDNSHFTKVTEAHDLWLKINFKKKTNYFLVCFRYHIPLHAQLSLNITIYKIKFLLHVYYRPVNSQLRMFCYLNGMTSFCGHFLFSYWFLIWVTTIKNNFQKNKFWFSPVVCQMELKSVCWTLFCRPGHGIQRQIDAADIKVTIEIHSTKVKILTLKSEEKKNVLRQ